MGISIYYEAERDTPLTAVERKALGEIAARHDAAKTFDDGEDFCVYDDDPDEPRTIFAGATGLPMSDTMQTVAACVYWANCLTEIRRAIPGAEWFVHMDDTDLEWDEAHGWHLPGMEWNETQGWHLDF